MDNSIVIAPGHPHILLGYIKRMNGIDDMVLLQDSEAFLREYEAQYPDDEIRLEEIRVACRFGCIAEMTGILNEAMWRKRSFINKASILLMHDGELKEYQMVEFIESFMQLFGWDFEMPVMRRWQAKKEETAEYQKQYGEQRRLIHKEEKKQFDDKRRVSINKINLTNSERGGEAFDEDNYDEEYKEDASDIMSNVRFTGQYDTGAVKKPSEKAKSKAKVNEPDNNSKSMPDVFDMHAYIQEEIVKKGIPFEKLMTLSVRRDLKNAIKGNPDAQYRMGAYYAEANSRHTDYNEAMKWYHVSASQGNKKAQFELGMLYDGGKVKCDDYKQKAMKCYMGLAESGYPTAQCMVAMKYRFGDGVDVDINEAIKWFKRAAFQGHVDAQRNLGDVYMAIHNREEARKWYERASAAGDVFSQKQLEKL